MKICEIFRKILLMNEKSMKALKMKYQRSLIIRRIAGLIGNNLKNILFPLSILFDILLKEAYNFAIR